MQVLTAVVRSRWVLGLLLPVVGVCVFFGAQTLGTTEPAPLLYDGKNALTRKEAADFSSFALYSLGDTFNGQPLVGVFVDREAPWLSGDGTHVEIPGSYTVTFAYDATCDRVEGCDLPVQIQVDPACALPQTTDFATDVLSGDRKLLPSGVTYQQFTDGHVRLWAGDVSISVTPGDAASPIDVAELVSVIQPVNDIAKRDGASLTAARAARGCPNGLIPDPIKPVRPDFDAPPPDHAKQ